MDGADIASEDNVPPVVPDDGLIACRVDRPFLLSSARQEPGAIVRVSRALALELVSALKVSIVRSES